MQTKQLIERYIRPKIQGKIQKWESEEDKSRLARLYFAAHILGSEPANDSQSRATNAIVAKHLAEEFDVFLPQVDNPLGVMHDRSQGWEMALIDMRAIELSDLVVALGGFGKDTSWEIGYASALGKPVFLYLPSKEIAELHIGDWMLLEGITAIIGSHDACELMRTSVAVPPFLRMMELNDLSRLNFTLAVLAMPTVGFFSRIDGVL